MIDLCLLLFGLLGSWLLGMACILLTGSYFARCSGNATVNRRFSERAGVGLVVGIGLTSWLQLLWCELGGSLGRPLSLAIAGIGWILAIIAYRSRSIVPAAKQTATTSRVTRACQFLVGLLFVNLLVQSLLTPQHLWDERAIYAIKSKVIFEDQTINSPDLKSPDFVQYHPRYPLLIPLAEHHVYALLGRVDDRLSKCIFPLMALGLMLTFAGVLMRHFSDGAAWGIAVLVGTVPVLGFWEYGFLCGQGDAPMACFHGLAVLFLWDWLRSRQTAVFSLFLGGILSGLALFVKDEGVAFLMVDSLLLFIFSITMQKNSWKQTARSAGLFMLSVLGVIVPWYWHRQSLPTTGEMAYFERLTLESLMIGVATLAWSTRHLASRMFVEASDWGLQWWGMVLSAFANPKRVITQPQLLLWLDVLGGLCGLLVAGMIAPTTVEEHIGGSSHRFLMQLAPVAILFMAGQWESVREE